MSGPKYFINLNFLTSVHGDCFLKNIINIKNGNVGIFQKKTKYIRSSLSDFKLQNSTLKLKLSYHGLIDVKIPPESKPQLSFLNFSGCPFFCISGPPC